MMLRRIGAVIAFVAAIGAAVNAQGVVKVGDKVPDFKFSSLLNNDGRMSLAEFRGSVVLLDWWGNHCPPCLGFAVPHAIKLFEEHAKDGLVCVLMESQQLPTNELPGFMMQKFPSNRCLVTSDSPFRTEHQENYVPFSAVIGVDGTLLVDGGTSAISKKLDETIDAELKKIKSGWGKTPEIAKARAQMHGRGNLSEARKILESARANIKDDAKEDFEAAVAELDAKLAVKKRSVKSLMDESRFGDAKNAALAYQAAVKGDAALEKEAAEMVAEFQAPEVDKEVKLDAALAKLMKGFADKGPGKDGAATLKSFAKKADGTKVGARAATLAVAAEYKIH